MSAPAALQLRDLSKSFAGAKGTNVRALAEVSLALPAGRSLALIGPSGCGKSTLLRCAVGLVAPDAGHVIIEGRELDRTSASELRPKIGYVVQSGGLFPHLTAADNVTLAARYQGWASSQILHRVEEMRELVQLPLATLKRHPRELSGGQQQRVGLMRALFLDPDLLLLDEPLGALDPMIRAELQQQLGEIFRKLGKTVCLVTHDLAEAALLCEEMCLLRDGAIEQQGSPSELFDSPASEFVARFVSAQSAPLDVLDRVRRRS